MLNNLFREFVISFFVAALACRHFTQANYVLCERQAVDREAKQDHERKYAEKEEEVTSSDKVRRL